MTRYRDMTTPELADWALHAFRTSHAPTGRLIYALAKRLADKAAAAAPDPRAIAVGKPHITLVRSGGLWPVYGPGTMWRCRGPFGGTQYGKSPADAYHRWRMVIERPARLVCLPNNLN
jgi:hypothetical protein